MAKKLSKRIATKEPINSLRAQLCFHNRHSVKYFHISRARSLDDQTYVVLRVTCWCTLGGRREDCGNAYLR
jgi:hypothetical protein